MLTYFPAWRTDVFIGACFSPSHATSCIRRGWPVASFRDAKWGFESWPRQKWHGMRSCSTLSRNLTSWNPEGAGFLCLRPYTPVFLSPAAAVLTAVPFVPAEPAGGPLLVEGFSFSPGRLVKYLFVLSARCEEWLRRRWEPFSRCSCAESAEVPPFPGTCVTEFHLAFGSCHGLRFSSVGASYSVCVEAATASKVRIPSAGCVGS